MPHLYLHFHGAEGWTYDEEGRDFADVGAALTAALSDARHIIAAEVMEAKPVLLASFIAVCDDDGAEAGRVTFRDALTIDG